MKIKLLFISICCFIQLEHSSQVTNNLLVKAADSSNFLIYINGYLQHNAPYNNIKITNYNKKSMALKIIIADSTKQEINKQIYFENNDRETSAELIHDDNIYKFRYTGEVPIGVDPIDSNQLVIKYHQLRLEMDSLFRNDPAFSSDSTFSNSATKDYTYFGETGCKPPNNDATPIINAINNEFFSADKLKKAKIGFTGKCYKVEDIINVISLFEFDDQKLELSLLAYWSTYDLENFHKIIDLFLLNSSKQKFQKFIDEN